MKTTPKARKVTTKAVPAMMHVGALPLVIEVRKSKRNSTGIVVFVKAGIRRP